MRHIHILKDVLLGDDGAAASIVDGNSELQSLQDGAIAFYTEDGTVLTAANASTELSGKNARVRVAVGGNTPQEVRITPPIVRSENGGYVKAPYNMGIKERQFLGNDGSTGNMNLPTLVEGDIATIRIIKYSNVKTIIEDKENYTHVVTAQDTAETIVDALVAKINADPQLGQGGSTIVVATKVGAGVGFQFDAKDFNTTFELKSWDIYSAATIIKDGNSNSLAIVYTSGTTQDILDLEELFNPNRGDTNRYLFPQKWFKEASKVISGEDYIQYSLKWGNPRERSQVVESEAMSELVIAVPNASVTFVIADFETILNAIFDQANTQNP